MAAVIKKTDLEIDEYNLEQEWINQSALYGKYARIAADARRELDEAKVRLDVVKSEVDKEIREDPDKFGLARVTEGSISNTIVRQSKYGEASQEVIDARYQLDLANSMTAALDHRRAALGKLVDLWLASYYSEPRAKNSDKEDVEAVERKATRRKPRQRSRD